METYVAACQEFGDSYVEVHVVRLDGDLRDFRGWVAGNLIRAATRSRNRSRTLEDELAAAELERAVQAGRTEWRTDKAQVDGSPVDFEYFPIGESTWIAIAAMSDAHIGVAARGVFFNELAFVRIDPAAADDN